jgi:hypothetical protein
VKNRQLSLSILSVFSALLLLFSCKKINEATDLGGGLIPPIDNINTFDTTINVEAYNDLFTFSGNPMTDDSTRSTSGDEHFLGLITNDPFFGKTDARIFLELKPPYYKYTFFNKPDPDSLKIDSVVLVLDYVGTYGDSITPQTIEVREISSEFRYDTAYLIRENNFTTSTLLGSTTVVPHTLNDSTYARWDTSKNQLRITLNNSFGERLLMYDTAGPNNAYSSDSAFREKFKGFALQSVSGGNAIMGFNLRGGNTKLAIYYSYADGNAAQPNNFDTTVAYFSFAANGFSASSNYIQRDHSGTPLLAAQGGTGPDPIVYIQATPGSFATIKMPDLALLNNRVVHRAELIMEQIHDVSDSTFPPPTFLYIDAFDPDMNKFRTVPYDLLFTSSASLNLGSFGIAPYIVQDGLGNAVRTWKFNLSRYVQHVVNDTEPVYDLRLFAPFYVINQYKPSSNSAASPQPISINPSVAKGRIRLAGNTGTGDTNPRRMRLRIIYSKL